MNSFTSFSVLNAALKSLQFFSNDNSAHFNLYELILVVLNNVEASPKKVRVVV